MFQTHVEAKSFTFIWNVLFQPLLFTLVGMEFRFEIVLFLSDQKPTLSVDMAIRRHRSGNSGNWMHNSGHFAFPVEPRKRFHTQGANSHFLFILFQGNSSGTLFIFTVTSTCTQAALVTTLLTLSKGDPIYEEESQLILVACVIAIIITSPLGLILLQFFGPSLLNEAQTRDQTTTTLADMSKSESNGVGIDL